VPVCVAAPLLFQWIFGREWQASGWLMLLLLPMWWAAAVVSPVSRLLVVMDRPALKFVFDLAFLLAPIAAMYALKGRGINTAVFGYGMAACAAYAVYAALLVIASADGRPSGPKVD
jgi:O-antigen/teichoic acid export membrane protein